MGGVKKESGNCSGGTLEASLQKSLSNGDYDDENISKTRKYSFTLFLYSLCVSSRTASKVMRHRFLCHSRFFDILVSVLHISYRARFYLLFAERSLVSSPCAGTIELFDIENNGMVTVASGQG